MLLQDQVLHSFSNISLDEKTLSNVFLGSKEHPIKKCSFSNIFFSKCIFDFNYIEECTFINCTFLDCNKEGSNLNCWFYGCNVPFDDSFIDIYSTIDIAEESTQELSDIQILELYFKVDHRTPRMKMISKIKDTFNDNKTFKRVFDDLVTNGYIYTNGDKSFISPAGIEYYNQNKS